MMAVVLLFAFAAPAWAQVDHAEGQSSVNNPQVGPAETIWDPVGQVWHVVRSDASGNTMTHEAFPAYLQWTFYSKVYSDTLSNVTKSIDSTGVFYTGAYKDAALMIVMSGGWNAQANLDSTMYIEVQVRDHYIAAADSATRFVSGRIRSGGGSAADTVGFFGAGANNARGVIATQSTVGVAAAGTYVVPVHANNAPGASGTSNISFPLTGLGWAPYRSLRFRVLNATAGPSLSYRIVRWDVTYVGTPL